MYKLKCQLTMGGGQALLENSKIVDDLFLKALDEEGAKDGGYISRKQVEKIARIINNLPDHLSINGKKLF